MGKSGLEKRQLLLDHTRVDDENEDRRRGGFLERRVVFDGGVLREELRGEVFVGYGGVVGREVVAGEAEGADPDLGGVIDGGEWVEDGAAGATAERGVGEDGHGREGLDRSVDGRDWDYAVCGLLLCAWNHIPWHSNAVLGFKVQEFAHFLCLFVCLVVCLFLRLARRLEKNFRAGRET